MQQQKLSIPPAVFDAFNEMIAKHWNGHSATFTQAAVVATILTHMPKPNRGEIYSNNWLDVESVYGEAGWRVEYGKPASNEPHEPTFTFSKKK